jgi:hypothetical protein
MAFSMYLRRIYSLRRRYQEKAIAEDAEVAEVRRELQKQSSPVLSELELPLLHFERP